MKPPIIVTGGPRSGTTLSMRFLRANGMQVGRAASQNQLVEGRIRDELYKPILRENGFDELAQYSLPPVGWVPSTRTVHQVRESILELAEVGDFSRPWGFKAIKGLLFWRILGLAFPDAKWLIVRRQRDEHIDSLLRTPFMKVHSTREGWGEYLDQIKRYEDDLLWSIDHARVFVPAGIRAAAESGNSLLYLYETTQWLGLEWRGKECLSVFNRTLYRRHN